MSSQNKQKVVGALILIAVLAIFIPLFLSSHTETPTMKSKPPVAPPMPVINLKIPPMPKQQAAVVKPAVMQAQPVANKATSAVPVVDAKPVTQAVSNNWRLKLGTFSYEKNSKRLVQQLKEKGFEAYSQQDTNSQGKQVYQVYIGPAVSKVEAVTLQKHLLQQMGMASMIVAYPNKN